VNVTVSSTNSDQTDELSSDAPANDNDMSLQSLPLDPGRNVSAEKFRAEQLSDI